jgi:hypothetical protein
LSHRGIDERIGAAEMPTSISSRVFVTKGGMYRLGLRPVDDAAPLIIDGKGRLRASTVKLYRLADTRDVAGGEPTSISEDELNAIPIVQAALPARAPFERAFRACGKGATPRFASGLPLPPCMAAQVDPLGHPREAELLSFTSTTWYTRRDLKRLGLRPNPCAVPFLVPILPSRNNDDALPIPTAHFHLFNEAQVAAVASACTAVQADLPAAADAMDGAVGVQQNNRPPSDDWSESGSCDVDDAIALDPPAAVRV